MKRILTFALILCGVSCNNTKKIIAVGDTQLQQGDYVVATYSFMDALKRQPDNLEVKNKLFESGRLAILKYLQDAENKLQQQSVVAAGEIFRMALQFHRSVQEAGIEIPLSETFRQTQTQTFKDAAVQLRLDGQNAFANQQYANAHRYYTEILSYAPLQAEEVAQEKDSVSWHWSEELVKKALIAEADSNYADAYQFFKDAHLRGLKAQRDVLGNDLFRVSSTWAYRLEQAQQYQSAIQKYQLAQTHALPAEREELRKALFRNHQLYAQAQEKEGNLLQVLEIYQNAQRYATQAEMASLNAARLEVHRTYADELIANKEWNAAITQLEAGLGFADDATQNEIREDILQVMLRQAVGEMDRGKYRTALRHTERALQYMPRHPDTIALRDAIFKKASQQVLILPLAPANDSLATLFANWIPQFNEAIELDNWQRLPRFIQTIPLVATRRALRQQQRQNQALTPNQAFNLAEELGGDWVLKSVLTQFEIKEQLIDSTSTKITNNKGISYNLLQYHFKAIAKARLTFQSFHAPTAMIEAPQHFEQEVELTFTELILPRNLPITSPQLSAEQRSMASTNARQDTHRRLSQILAEQMTQKWQEKINDYFESLSNKIP